jgi:hypothetical protein
MTWEYYLHIPFKIMEITANSLFTPAIMITMHQDCTENECFTHVAPHANAIFPGVSGGHTFPEKFG